MSEVEEAKLIGVTRKEVRKVLNKKIVKLNDIIDGIDSLLTKMEIGRAHV